MKNQIKLEELAMFLLGIYLFSRLEYAGGGLPSCC